MRCNNLAFETESDSILSVAQTQERKE